MFKIFLRSIVFSNVLRQNLVFNFNAFISQRTRFYSKSKKTKKMFRNWEFTAEANDYQRELQQRQQQQQQQTSYLQQQTPRARQYRLVSYNILSQDLLTEHLYLYCDIENQYLRWEHRLRCLQNELNFLNADILCIQEMQFNHLKEFVELLSRNRRMEYVYKKKTGHRTDGCAIIYDRDIFQLLAQEDLELYQPNMNAKLDRENVAIFAKFKLCHEPHKEIVIATTHLLYNPRRHDVRVAQVELILAKLRHFARKCDNVCQSLYLPVILTGDMNSEPDSPPINMLTSITSDERQQQLECQPENSVSKSQQTIPVGEQFSLKEINFGRNCASTHHDRWITVDYILRSVRNQNMDDDEDKKGREAVKSDIKVLSLYKLPSVNNCERIGKIPNHMLGSDHYLQAIEFIVV